MQITINRPEKRNAFRPETIEEIMRCMTDARDDPDIGVIILTGGFLLHAASSPFEAPRHLHSFNVRRCLKVSICRSARHCDHMRFTRGLRLCLGQGLHELAPDSGSPAGAGTKAFCSGGDQGVRGAGGYVGPDKVSRLNVLDLQVFLSWGKFPRVKLALTCIYWAKRAAVWVPSSHAGPAGIRCASSRSEPEAFLLLSSGQGAIQSAHSFTGLDLQAQQTFSLRAFVQSNAHSSLQYLMLWAPQRSAAIWG